MRVEVDSQRCQAYANCVSVAPDVFALDEATGTAVVLIAEPPAELHAAVEQAVVLCPMRAITTSSDGADGR